MARKSKYDGMTRGAYAMQHFRENVTSPSYTPDWGQSEQDRADDAAREAAYQEQLRYQQALEEEERRRREEEERRRQQLVAREGQIIRQNTFSPYSSNTQNAIVANRQTAADPKSYQYQNDANQIAQRQAEEANGDNGFQKYVRALQDRNDRDTTADPSRVAYSDINKGAIAAATTDQTYTNPVKGNANMAQDPSSFNGQKKYSDDEIEKAVERVGRTVGKAPHFNSIDKATQAGYAPSISAIQGGRDLLQDANDRAMKDYRDRKTQVQDDARARLEDVKTSDETQNYLDNYQKDVEDDQKAGTARVDAYVKKGQQTLGKPLTAIKSAITGQGDELNWLNDEELKQYQYTVGKYGEKAGEQFLKGKKDNVNQRQAEYAEKATYQLSKDNPAIGAGLNLASSTANGAMGYAATVRNATGNQKISEYDPSLLAARMQNASQEGTAQGVWENVTAGRTPVTGIKTPVKGVSYNNETARKVSDFLVGTGLSSLNSAVAGLTVGNIFEPAVLASFSGNAAGSSMLGASQDENTSQGQATANAIAQGVAESFFEKFSLENLDAMRQMPATSLKGAIKNWAKSSFTEGSEEFFTDISNDISDLIINGKNSEPGKIYEQNKENGDDDITALGKAMVSRVGSAGLSFLGGAISGGMATGSANIAGYADANQQARLDYSNISDRQLDQIKQSIPTREDAYSNRDSYRYGQDALKVIDEVQSNGGVQNMTDRQKTRLYVNLHGLGYAVSSEEPQAPKANNSSIRVEDDSDTFHINDDADYRLARGQGEFIRTADDLVRNMDEAYSTNKNSMTPREMYGMMGNAQTAEQLTDVYRAAQNSTNDQTRQLANIAYQTQADDLIGQQKATQEDFQRAQSTLTEADAYQQARSGQKVDESLLTTPSLRQAANYGAQANILLNSNAKIEGRELGDIRITAKTKDAPAMVTISGKNYDADTVLNNLPENISRSDKALLSNAMDQNTDELANTYMQNAPEGMSVGSYNNAFNRLVAGANAGRSFEDSYQNIGAAASLLDEDSARQIYNAGAKEMQQQIAENVQDQGKSIAKYGTGSVFDERKNKSQKLTYMPLVQAMAKSTGMDFYIADDLSDNINGQFNRSMSAVTLNVKNSDNMLNTLYHEGFGEVLQAYNAKGAERVQQAIADYIVDTDGIDGFADTAKKYQRAYRNVEGTKSFYDAFGEATNDAIAGIFSSEQGIKDFSDWAAGKYQQPSKFKQVMNSAADFFKGIGDSFHELLTTGHLSNMSRKTARMGERRAADIRGMILQEMDTALQNYQNTTINPNATSNNAYSLSNIDDGTLSIGNNKYQINEEADAFVSETGRTIPIIQNKYSAKDLKDSEHTIRDTIYRELGELTGKDLVIKEDGEKVRISGQFKHKYTHNGFMKYAPARDKAVKMNSTSSAQTMIENATGGRWEPDRGHKHGTKAGRGWRYYDTDLAVRTDTGYDVYRAQLQIMQNSIDNRDYVYDIAHLKKISSADAFRSRRTLPQSNRRASNETVSQNLHNVNSSVNNSLNVDSDGNITIPAYTADAKSLIHGTEQDREAARQQRTDIENVWREIIDEDNFDGLSFQNALGQEVTLTRSIRPGSDWQLSWFDKDGNAAGHREYNAENITNLPSDLRQEMGTGHEAKVKLLNPTKEYQQLVKNIPTVNRFSLDVDQPVQQTEDLIAVNNCEEDALMENLRLGGLASPSIAIIRDAMQHNDFGPISLLFSKDTIDPAKNRRNNVYGGDTWTPTFPGVEYDVDSDLYYTVAKDLKKTMQGKVPAYLISEMERFNHTETGGPDSRGMQGVVDAAKNNYGMKAAYLASKGISIEDNAKQVSVGKYSENDVNQFEAFKPALSEIQDEYLADRKTLNPQELWNKYRDKFQEAYSSYADTLTDEKQKEKWNNYADLVEKRPLRKYNALDRITNAIDYYENGNPASTETERDEDAIRQDINSQIDDNDYEQWIRNTYDGLIKGVGIPNGRDYMTASGNRRTFKQLHYPYTLENVQRAKEESGTTGVDGSGWDKFYSNAAKQFRSIDDIHQNEGQLEQISEDDHQALVNQYSNRLDEIASRVNPDNIYDAEDVIAEALRRYKTANGIENYVREYGKVYKGLGNDVLNLARQVSEMQTKYFEAKPNRIVETNEIVKAVVPDNSSSELLSMLDERNIPYQTYEAGNNDARQAAINGTEGIRFSLNFDDEDQYNPFGDTFGGADDVVFGDTPSADNTSQESMDRYEKMRADQKETADILGEGMKALKDIHVDHKTVQKLAEDIVETYGSNYDAKKLADNIEKVFAYGREHAGKFSNDEMLGIIDQIAYPVVEDTEIKLGQQEYDDFRSVLKAHPVRLTDTQMQEAISIAGSYQGFKSMFPELNLSKNARSTLDSVWSEMVGQAGGVLDADVSEGEEVSALVDAIQTMRPRAATVMDDASMEQSAYELGMQIIDDYMNAAYDSAGKKTDDVIRLKTQSEKMQDKMRQFEKDLKADYNERLVNARKEMDKETQDKVRGLKADHRRDVEVLTKALHEAEDKAANLEKQLKSANKKIDNADARKLKALKKQAQRYDAIVAQGTTPASKSQGDVKNSVKTLSDAKYSAGVKSVTVSSESSASGRTVTSKATASNGKTASSSASVSYTGDSGVVSVKPTGGSGNETINIAPGWATSVTVDRTAPYNQGVSDADARVNSQSANYKGGYSQGVNDADARSNPNSANYKAGYNAGTAAGITKHSAIFQLAQTGTTDMGEQHNFRYIQTSGLYTSKEYETHYNEGFSAGEAKGKAEGTSAGTDSGYQSGYKAGYDQGKSDGYDSGKTDGYNDGYSAGSLANAGSGYTDGYNAGYDKGKSDGNDEGYKNGQSDGYTSGYSDGKSDGVTQGHNDVIKSPGSYLTAKTTPKINTTYSANNHALYYDITPGYYDEAYVDTTKDCQESRKSGMAIVGWYDLTVDNADNVGRSLTAHVDTGIHYYSGVALLDFQNIFLYSGGANGVSGVKINVSYNGDNGRVTLSCTKENTTNSFMHFLNWSNTKPRAKLCIYLQK